LTAKDFSFSLGITKGFSFRNKEKHNMSKLDFQKIARHAEENRWSAAKIAEKTGLAAVTVLSTFKGENTPSATNLKAICDTIGLPIEEAFTEEAAA